MDNSTHARMMVVDSKQHNIDEIKLSPDTHRRDKGAASHLNKEHCMWTYSAPCSHVILLPCPYNLCGNSFVTYSTHTNIPMSKVYLSTKTTFENIQGGLYSQVSLYYTNMSNNTYLQRALFVCIMGSLC